MSNKIGEWLAFGEAKWGERYVQAADALGYDQGYLRKLAWIHRSTSNCIAAIQLPLSYREAIAAEVLDDEDRTLLAAKADGLTRNGFRSFVKEYIRERGLTPKKSSEQEIGAKIVEEIREARGDTTAAAQPADDDDSQNDPFSEVDEPDSGTKSLFDRWQAIVDQLNVNDGTSWGVYDFLNDRAAWYEQQLGIG